MRFQRKTEEEKKRRRAGCRACGPAPRRIGNDWGSPTHLQVYRTYTAIRLWLRCKLMSPCRASARRQGSAIVGVTPQSSFFTRAPRVRAFQRRRSWSAVLSRRTSSPPCDLDVPDNFSPPDCSIPGAIPRTKAHPLQQKTPRFPSAVVFGCRCVQTTAPRAHRK